MKQQTVTYYKCHTCDVSAYDHPNGCKLRYTKGLPLAPDTYNAHPCWEYFDEVEKKWMRADCKGNRSKRKMTVTEYQDMMLELI